MLEWNGRAVGLSHFPDGTLHMNVPEEIPLRTLNNIWWKYESDSELFALMCLTDTVRNMFGTDIEIVLQMLYLPHARMDRIKKASEVFTLKSFAKAINSLKFKSVVVLDPHSHVAEALIDNILVESPIDYISRAVEIVNEDSANFMFFFPDEGAMKRYSGMIRAPYLFGVKRRDWGSGKILGLDVVGNIALVKGRDFLIVDDICSRGGTFLHSARKLKELGANKIYLYVSHCENTVLDGELISSGLVERIFTTDSVFTKEHPMIEVFRL